MAEPNPGDARLAPLTEANFPTVTRLAESIWRQHYTAIVGRAQIDYMLAGRFVPEKLRQYIDATDRWFEILVRGDVAVGYCSYSLTTPQEMKLEQLYLSVEARGHGLGGMMMRRVEEQAKAHGRTTLMLTVNRHNAGSIAVYTRAGFVVREEVCFEIGSGFVMDDYVMVKGL